MPTEEESGGQFYTCTAPRADGQICGFQTSDENAFCPHDMIIVSTGKRYIAPEKQEICPVCKRPLNSLNNTFRTPTPRVIDEPTPDAEAKRRATADVFDRESKVTEPVEEIETDVPDVPATDDPNA